MRLKRRCGSLLRQGNCQGGDKLIHALYSDGACYIVLYDATDRKTYLQTTSGGRMDVPSILNGATFVSYDFSYTPPQGLRPVDVCENLGRLNRFLALLTPPPQPAAPPQTEPDTRLHVNGRGFRAIQEAVAAERARIEEEHARARRSALNAIEPDARTDNDIRRINGMLGERWSPKRPEPKTE